MRHRSFRRPVFYFDNKLWRRVQDQIPKPGKGKGSRRTGVKSHKRMHSVRK